MDHTPLLVESVDSRIAKIAASRAGWIPRVVLRQCGVSRGAIIRRLRSGMLIEVLPRLYRLGASPPELTRDERLSGALLCAERHRPVLSHLTAAAELGLWDRGRRSRIDVLLPARISGPGVPWLRVHSTDDLPEGDRDVVGQYPTSGVARTLLDSASELTEFQLTRLYHEAEFRYGVDLDEIEERNRRRFRWPYSSIVRAAIEHRRAGSAGTRSASEDHLLAGIVRAQLPVPAICNPAATGVVGEECDMAWTARRLVVEVDGVTVHRRRGDRERDARRDAALIAAGWRVERFSSEEVWMDREGVVARIGRLLAT